MTNRPNRGWRIRGNTARAVIKRKSDPLEITMALESQPNGKQSLTLKAEPVPGSSADPPKLANYEFAPGKGRASGDGPAFTRFALVAAWQTPRQRAEDQDAPEARHVRGGGGEGLAGAHLADDGRAPVGFQGEGPSWYLDYWTQASIIPVGDTHRDESRPD